MSPHRRRRGRSPLILSICSIAALLLLAPTAMAAGKNTLSGERTTLEIDPAIAKALDDEGVKVRARGKAQLKKGNLRFPIIGGKLAFDGSEGGKIRHAGAVKLGGGHEKLILRRPAAKLNGKPRLMVLVGNGQLRLFDLDLSKVTLARTGLSLTVDNIVATLNARSARILRKTYGLPVKAGTEFGTLRVEAFPRIVQLRDEGDTTLALDDDAAAALDSLGIAVAPIGPATAEEDGLAFPITGGKLSIESFMGKVRHEGGIRLSKDGTVVELTNFLIKSDDDPDLVGNVNGAKASLLNLDLGTAAIALGEIGEIFIGGAEARLTEEAAAALNAAFDTTAFTEGFLLGLATVEAFAQ